VLPDLTQLRLVPEPMSLNTCAELKLGIFRVSALPQIRVLLHAKPVKTFGFHLFDDASGPVLCLFSLAKEYLVDSGSRITVRGHHLNYLVSAGPRIRGLSNERSHCCR
jgi:hypothetical protein